MSIIITDNIIDTEIHRGYFSISIKDKLKDEIKFIRSDSITKIKPKYKMYNPIMYNNNLLTNNNYDTIIFSIGYHDISETFDPISEDYMKKYENIILYLLNFTKKLVIISPYRPYDGEDSPYNHIKEEIDLCYKQLIDFLKNITEKYKLIMINLYDSFKQYNNVLYQSKSEIYMKEEYLIKIIKLIKYVINNKVKSGFITI